MAAATGALAGGAAGFELDIDRSSGGGVEGRRSFRLRRVEFTWQLAALKSCCDR
jgi:hypothetical protein